MITSYQSNKKEKKRLIFLSFHFVIAKRLPPPLVTQFDHIVKYHSINEKDLNQYIHIYRLVFNDNFFPCIITFFSSGKNIDSNNMCICPQLLCLFKYASTTWRKRMIKRDNIKLLRIEESDFYSLILFEWEYVHVYVYIYFIEWSLISKHIDW